MYRSYGKRLLDLMITIPALSLLLPLIALLAFIVHTKLGRPIFYRQKRAGLYGNPFELLKFRTMTNDCDTRGILLPDAERLTSFGCFLRSTSLDEIPELFNVLKGEMSLVGPRPLLMQYLDRYTLEQARRHEVKTGITGWAQVKGRNAISWEQKFEHDLWYIGNLSLRLDLKILTLTVLKILKREGISQPGYATAEEFKGIEQKP